MNLALCHICNAQRLDCRSVRATHQPLWYSATIVYNNFPWPVDITAPRKAAIEKAAKHVLDVRKLHATNDLATLYDPVYMTRDLRDAAQGLGQTGPCCL